MCRSVRSFLHRRRGRRGDDRGASPLVTFIVAIGLFGVLVWSFLTIGMGLEANRTAPQSASLDGAAGASLNVLLGTAGVPPAWGDSDASADAVARLGLREDGWSIRVSEAKLARFQGAGLGSTANGKVDYEEARAALGLTEHQFHLRTMPVFDPYGVGYYGVEGLDATRVAYIGDYSSNALTESGASAKESGVIDAFPLLFTNETLTAASVVPGGDKVADHKPTIERYLILRLAGWLKTENALDATNAGTYTWHLYDATHVSGITTIPAGTHVMGVGTATTPNYGPTEDDRLVSPLLDFRGAAQPRLAFREWIDGECTMLVGAQCLSGDYAVVEVSPTGLPGTWTELDLDHPYSTSGAWRTRTLDLSTCVPCLTGPVHVGFRWVTDATNARKGWLLDDVRAYDAATDATIWKNGNEFEASRYQVVVVGSNVDQNGLNEDTIKFRLRDWVLAGGDLYVLGSTDRRDEWMQPIFGAGLATGANSPPYAPDPTHPLILTPNELGYSSYPRANNVWKIGQDSQAKFAQVVGYPPSGTDRDDILSVSVPGAYQNGTVILTTYLGYQMGGDEATKLLANFFMYGKYAVLYLDYGPSIPPGVAVATHTRLVLAPKTIDPLGPRLELLVTIQVWRG